MAKPDNWETLEPHQKREIATGMLKTMRGTFIMSQALHIAVTEMRKVEGPRQEVSNIEDMEMLQEALFGNLYPSVAAATEAWQNKPQEVKQE